MSIQAGADTAITDAGIKPGGVLFMTNFLHLGGVTTHMLALGQGLMRRGVRVGVITRGLDEDKPFGRQYFENAGFRVYQAEGPGYSFGPKKIVAAWRGVRAVKSHVRDFKADLLHVHAPALCLLSRLSGTPYVTTFNINVDGPKKIAIAKAANKLTSTAFGRRAIAISRSLEKDMHETLHIPAERIRLTPYTIDESQFPPATAVQKAAARAHFQIPDGALVVCMLAALHPRKNHKLLLDALAAARQRGANVVALLAGTGYGGDPEKIQEYATSLGLSDVARFIGHQSPLGVYHASDVCVLPSLQEGMPLTTIEAMHCGLVPIRTPAEGADEQIVDGETGYIVPFGQPDVLADRLVKLAGDPALQAELATGALNRARERFTSEQMVSATLRVYSEALADR